MKYIPLLIILLIVLLVVFGICYLKKKAGEFSRALFGTSDIKKAADRLQKEYSSTPKSVSAMTSLLLPKIVSDFPDFQYDEMKERAENILLQYVRAITAHSAGKLTGGNTELRQQLESYIQMLSAEEKREHFEQVRLHRTEISQYRKTDGRCIITFQTAFECYHYVTDNSGRVTDGSKEHKYQTRYNMDLIYIQDRNLAEHKLDHAWGVNCPNCGAPISGLGAKHCEYCGSPVIEVNIHAWSFSNIEEVK